MAKEFIVDGAQCKCSFGTTPGVISVTDQVLSYINGDKPCATSKTIGAQAVKTPFGSCNASFPSRPCVPNIVQWGKYFTKLKIGADSFPLTDESQGTCSFGGSIDFINTGQIPIVGAGQMTTASAESQSEIDPVGDPMALSEHQVTVLSEISAGPAVPSPEVKVVKAAWVNANEAVLKKIQYKETAYILIETENLDTGKVKVKIIDSAKGGKVAEWDKAKDSDMEFDVDIADNKGEKAFTSTDEWFSKRALEKTVSFEVYYDNEKKELPKQSLKIGTINYNKEMAVSENGVRFTACEEAIGFICPDGKIRAYKDTKGNWTIGIGEMTGITENTVLDSKETAFDRFKAKIEGDFQKQARNLLHKHGVKRKLEQYEFDAIVDLVYNAWSCDTLVGKIADGEVITESTFVNFKGSGLAARRKAEYKLYANEITNVTGPTEYHRKDNTNGGYDKITKEVQETQKITENGKTTDVPVFEMVDGKKVPKMKKVEEAGFFVVESKENYTINY